VAVCLLLLAHRAVIFAIALLSCYPSDAMLARVGLYAMAIPSVCLCACLCAKYVLCIKTAKHFVEILLPPDSPIILLSRH